MAWQMQREGSATIQVPTGKITADLPVFYNPVMQMNRDITLQVLANIGDTLKIADPLAGSGVRAIRMLKELPRSVIHQLWINDGNNEAYRAILKNFTLSDLKKPQPAKRSKAKGVFLGQEDANRFLTDYGPFHYIDIDPFGSPNPFLDTAVRTLLPGGVLAVTATDTSALAGSHPPACRRKYWAEPLKNEFMQETGCRILIRKVQLIAAQYDRALIPVLTYADLHYVRVFFVLERGNPEPILQQHQFLRFCAKCGKWDSAKQNSGTCCEQAMQIAGPLWIGQLWDRRFVKLRLVLSGDSFELLSLLEAESALQTVGFYDLHKISKRHKIPLRPIHNVQEALTKAGFKSCRTHFSGTALRSDADLEEMKKAMG
ncbi:MAG TPA: tRNA (guanine(26)-N(2))-dimethyltransferase [Candidatus Nanoarchaeia archaeon]|nr:tRNA (guanine(26)-N(2))-dimethyltransferase [Candidatus Nanoarchaeia archaeon]